MHLKTTAFGLKMDRVFLETMDKNGVFWNKNVN